MKKCLFVYFICIMSLNVWSQIPNDINYQAVVRNSMGNLITNQDIGFRLSILQGTTTGTPMYVETQIETSNAYGVCNLKIGSGTLFSGNMSTIDWSTGSYFLKVEIDQTGGTSYIHVGTSELLSVPYALYANKADHAKNIENDVLYFTDSDTLFAVKDRQGNIVFAVYPSGAQVYVSSTTKGKLGGFAVSGRGATKGDENYLEVTPDSTRVYVNEYAKGKLGGFAVSGRGATKGITNDYLQVTKDSTRIYINDNLTKGKLGGFAVSGRGATKIESSSDYFNISGNTQVEKINNEPRIMWYPAKSAFLAGEVHVGSVDSVGTNSTALGYRSIAKGNYSQAMGYNSMAGGHYSTAIGNNAMANDSNSFAFGNYAQANGQNSFAFGDSAIAKSKDSYAIGAFSYASGLGSFSIGSKDRDESDLTYTTLATGDYAFAIGYGVAAEGRGSIAIGNEGNATGEKSMSIGRMAFASGDQATALSYSTAEGIQSFAAGGGNATGIMATAISPASVASGDNSIAIGYGSNATAYHSTVIGGYQAKATGKYATSIGYNTTAHSAYSFVVGLYNLIEGDPNSPASTDPLFVIGNGTYLIPSNALTVLKNGNTGIGTSAPNTKLDIDGDIALRQKTPTILSADVNNYNIGTGSYFRLSSSAAVNVTGIANGVDGKIIIITNVGSSTITFKNASTPSLIANRFLFSIVNDIIIDPNHSITLIYDSISQRWRDISVR